MEQARTVAAPVATVRAALSKALREQRFEVTAERLTSLEGKRGSQLAAGALQPKKSPVGIKIELAGDAETTTVSVSLFDRWRAPGGKAWGQNRIYADLFTETASAVDAALRSVDPNVILTPATFNSTAASVGLLERTNVASGNAGQKAAQRVDQWLGGTARPQPTGPQVVIAAPDGEAILDASRVQGMLTVALMISRTPGLCRRHLRPTSSGWSARSNTSWIRLRRGWCRSSRSPRPTSRSSRFSTIRLASATSSRCALCRPAPRAGSRRC
jgi:hypothetical protein